MPELEKDEQKARNMRCFIEATRKLIEEGGIGKVSIRKISEKAGLHNSTIYLYFKDVEQLILFASLKYFTAYTRMLQNISPAASPEETFFVVWSAFGQTVFEKGDIFYNFFFGKYSQNLTPIFRQYYELYPDEAPHYSSDIEEMYYGNNIQERCLKILHPLSGIASVRVNDQNIELVNEIIVSCLKELMMDKRANPDLDPLALNEKLLRMIQYVVGYTGNLDPQKLARINVGYEQYIQ